jgi:hypothetical protein
MPILRREPQGYVTISIVRFFEFLGFFIAFFILYTLFNKIEVKNHWIALTVFVISLVAVKTDIIFYILNRDIGKNIKRVSSLVFYELRRIFLFLKKIILPKTWRRLLGHLKSSLKNTQLSRAFKKTVKYSTVIFKQLFFNVSYDIFPIFLIWVIVIGFFYVFLGYSINLGNSFINIIVAVSILLAIFQYFIQRHEEKLFAKISRYPQKIQSIILDETMFNKFLTSITNRLLQDAIKKVVDPKLSSLDLLSRILHDEYLRKLFFGLKRDHYPIPIQLTMSYQSSDQRYLLMEMDLNENYRDELFTVYKKFFLEDAYRKIITRIHKEMDVEEFGILIQSNINIFQEVIPDLININLRDELDSISSGKSIEVEIPREASFKEFREYLSWVVNDELRKELWP